MTALQHEDGTPTLHVAAPILHGAPDETLLREAARTFTREGCTLFAAPDRLAGFALAPAGLALEDAAREVYRRVFAATRELQLHRIWNYVPGINAHHDGLENYRAFCRGRSHAFEAQFGREFQRRLPAASAVGSLAGPLAVAFVASAAESHHFENPQQVPAFEYPPAYGPCPPSFSRATRITRATRREVFISGTAAIRGHATIAPDDLAGQLACTRENLNVIARTAGAGDNFGATDDWQRTVKVYVRHARDFALVRADLERHLLQADDDVTYLHADLCRADLLVEVEAVLTKR